MSDDLAPPANPHLFGHAAAEQLFLRALAGGRLAHAWMLTGPNGVGKATLAFRLARALLGGEAARGDPAHPVFRMLAGGAHPDFRLLKREPDPRTKRMRKEIVVEQVRAAAESLQNTAAMGGARVLLIDWADELNSSAANALLKLVEEPPAGVVILMVVQRPGLLPRTMASRCAVLRLAPLADAEMADALARLLPDLPAERRAALLPAARGSPGRAVRIETTGWLDAYAGIFDGVTGGGLAQRLGAAEILAARAQGHGIEAAVDILAELMRRAAWLAAGRAPPGELVEGEALGLQGIALRLGLDRLGAIWEKQAALLGRVEALNLDPLQSFLQAIELVAVDRPASAGASR